MAGKFARMLIRKLREECDEELSKEDKINILCIEIAGLCHDLGNYHCCIIASHDNTLHDFQYTII